MFGLAWWLCTLPMRLFRLALLTFVFVVGPQDRLEILARFALRLRANKTAGRLASALMRSADRTGRDDFMIQGSRREAHRLLGLVALRNGDREQAKQRLLLSATGTRVSAFGPNMLLAKELLERGEREVVLEFIQGLHATWDHGSDKLDRWATDIRAGHEPKFGANLLY